MNVQELANFLWSVADLLRGDYKQSDYGDVILPLTILRRLDCVLEKTKEAVVAKHAASKGMNEDALEKVLNKIAGQKFHNSSKYDFEKLMGDPNNIARNMRNYLAGFSSNAREIIEKFKFEQKIADLDKKNLLFLVAEKFAAIDLHPKRISNMEMGYVFEELIRKFAEISNETAGEHFTPREVIRLMVNLLFANDGDILTQMGIIKTLYDCACGTGGMLSVAEEYLVELNPEARLEVFGQELNDQSYAICKSDMLIKGQNAANIKFGNSFTEDLLQGETFDYMLANPPFGVEWKKVQKEIFKEYEELGFGGRFGAGLPRISDGSFLFLQHLISKMKKGEQGSRIAIVFNGSPLFSGGAGSGESEIRRWIIENDMLETIVALPDQLFYNTGISTYIWIVTNKKETRRKGKVQLINAVTFFKKMSRSLGNKRNELSDDDIANITKIYGDFKTGKHCKIFNNSDFGYSYITVERPLVEDGKIVKDKNGDPKADAKLRDSESIPLKKGQLTSTEKDIQEYMEKEVLPHVPDAWVDHDKTKIGYEINFTKYFYEYKPLRPLKDIRADILALEKETEGMLREIVE
jgi:type I restriction enzyme M protein